MMRLVDEAREVRTAAARALSNLSFDRADAYARVSKTADEATLVSVAQAIVGTGMANQAINRLIGNDQRQAYEAFSLLSLLIKAKEVSPLLEGIASNSDTQVRLALVRLMNTVGGVRHLSEMREITRCADAPAEVRDAVEAIAVRATNREV